MYLYNIRGMNSLAVTDLNVLQVVNWTVVQGRLSPPLRPWSKIPRCWPFPSPTFPLPLPLFCPIFPPLFRSRKPLTSSPSLIFHSRPCKQGSGGFSPGEKFSNLDSCRWNLMHFWQNMTTQQTHCVWCRQFENRHILGLFDYAESQETNSSDWWLLIKSKTVFMWQIFFLNSPRNGAMNYFDSAILYRKRYFVSILSNWGRGAET